MVGLRLGFEQVHFAMSHDWIFDVLADLRSYAERNGLPRLAEKADELLDVARDEIGGLAGQDEGGTPSSGRMN